MKRRMPLIYEDCRTEKYTLNQFQIDRFDWKSRSVLSTGGSHVKCYRDKNDNEMSIKDNPHTRTAVYDYIPFLEVTSRQTWFYHSYVF